jgi:hypothetical protein
MAAEVRGQLMSSKMLRAFPRQSTGAAETVAASANGIRKLMNCMMAGFLVSEVGRKEIDGEEILIGLRKSSKD